MRICVHLNVRNVQRNSAANSVYPDIWQVIYTVTIQPQVNIQPKRIQVTIKWKSKTLSSTREHNKKLTSLINCMGQLSTSEEAFSTVYNKAACFLMRTSVS
mmetsp:Transcript_5287/g.9243  ORF Transcript_5287/g.9243 Transcript_5287/m.9243 type:complete len:101 (-) Transcript_5287:45-347(-)